MGFQTFDLLIPNSSAFPLKEEKEQIECFLYLLVESLERQTFLDHISHEIEASQSLINVDQGVHSSFGSYFAYEAVVRQYFSTETWIHYLTISTLCDPKSKTGWHIVKKLLLRAHSEANVLIRTSINRRRLELLRQIRNAKLAHFEPERELEKQSHWDKATQDCAHLINTLRTNWGTLYKDNAYCRILETPLGKLGQTHEESFDFLCDHWIDKGQKRANRLIEMYRSMDTLNEIEAIIEEHQDTPTSLDMTLNTNSSKHERIVHVVSLALEQFKGA
jgi:hypothetical protein